MSSHGCREGGQGEEPRPRRGYEPGGWSYLSPAPTSQKKPKKLLINVICQYAFAPRDWSRSITRHLLCHLPHLAKPLHPSPGPESWANIAGCQAAPGVPARGQASLPAPGSSLRLGLASSVCLGWVWGLLRDKSAAFREQKSELPASPRCTDRAEKKKKKTPADAERRLRGRARTCPGAHPDPAGGRGKNKNNT